MPSITLESQEVTPPLEKTTSASPSATYILSKGSRNNFLPTVPVKDRQKTYAKVGLAVFLILAAFATSIFLLLSNPKKFAYLNDRCGTINGVSVAPPQSGNPNSTGLCCSRSGYAGYTSDHCGEGCQTSFGRCNDLRLQANDLQTSRLVSHNCINPNDFALTFDDGPCEFTESLLDYLKSAGVKATFFLNGNGWKQNYSIPFSNLTVQRSRIFERADVVKRAFQDGHQICSHTWSHISVSKINPYNLTYEISRLNYHFTQILGKVPTCFRPPYGDYEDVDVPSLKVLQGMGYGPDAGGAVVGWNWDPKDWSRNTSSDIEVMARQLSNISAGAISLNHDVAPTTADFRINGSLIPNGVKPFAQVMVEHLKANGWNLVTIDQCLGYSVGSMYRPATPSDLVCGDSNAFGGRSCTS